MNKSLKITLEVIGALVITFVISLSSPLNPFMSNAFTAMQDEILDIAFQIREGFLAYVEVPGHYGPVLYEFYGLGYLPTDTHVVQFAMECGILFLTVFFQYKTAKLFTSEIFAFISTGILTILEWGALTHAGAEEMLFFIMSLTCYHVARQLKFGYLSYHSYLLAIDLGLVFFLQPGYVIIWIILVLFFAVKFLVDGIEGKQYRSFIFSTIEGLVTVALPMGAYLVYFKNSKEFWQEVVIYNFNNIGGFGDGMRILCSTPWIALLLVMVVVTIIKVIFGEKAAPLVCWIAFIILTLLVIALQGDNLDSFVQLSKAVYGVPIACVFSLLDKVFGLKVEEREF